LTTLMPEGESLRQAVRWISEQRQGDPKLRLSKLIQDAALRFDLTPLESDFLWRELVEQQEQPPAK
jgi:hypothetical protein